MIIRKTAQTVPIKAKVIDTLESESTTDALSAKQGKVLNDKIQSRKIETHCVAVGSYNPHWVYIGDFEFTHQGQYAVLDCFLGDGQNGWDYQNTHAQIIIKQGWTGAELPIGVTTRFDQNYSKNVKVKIKHLTLSKCALYIYLPFTYNDLTFLLYGSYYTFAKNSTYLTEEPETDKESTYYNISINSKSILVVKPDKADIMIGTTSETKYDFYGTKFEDDIDDSLELYNGGILCKRAGTVYIEAHAQFYGGTTGNGSQTGIIIHTSSGRTVGKHYTPYDIWYTGHICSGYINVNAGDVIYMSVYTSNTDVGVHAWEDVTYMSVEYKNAL